MGQVAPKQTQNQQTPLHTQAPNSALRPVIETTDVAAHGPLQLKLGHENELQLKILHVADEWGNDLGKLGFGSSHLCLSTAEILNDVQKVFSIVLEKEVFVAADLQLRNNYIFVQVETFFNQIL